MLSYKVLFYGTIGVCICCLGSYCYGYHAGKAKVTAEYTQEKAQYLNQISSLQLQYRAKEIQYNEDLNKVKAEYAQAREDYIHTISELKSSYSSRLQQSEQRAMLYQRKATDSKGCSALADLSGRLDRSLTEGISLVRELRDTIKLRDSQIKVLRENYSSLIKVINND